MVDNVESHHRESGDTKSKLAGRNWNSNNCPTTNSQVSGRSANRAKILRLARDRYERGDRGVCVGV